jgi:hypothetical protein
MDYHTYTEVYLEGRRCVFDARYNSPRIGRVKIADGLDAADCAFSTTVGDARLTSIKVWAGPTGTRSRLATRSTSQNVWTEQQISPMRRPREDTHSTPNDLSLRDPGQFWPA